MAEGGERKADDAAGYSVTVPVNTGAAIFSAGEERYILRAGSEKGGLPTNEAEEGG